MPAKATFISFDADHDESLKNAAKRSSQKPKLAFQYRELVNPGAIRQ